MVFVYASKLHKKLVLNRCCTLKSIISFHSLLCFAVRILQIEEMVRELLETEMVTFKRALEEDLHDMVRQFPRTARDLGIEM